MSSSEIEKFGLVIIQSLGKTEKQTGKILSEELIKYKQFKEPNLTCEFYDVNSKNELLELLKKISNETASGKFHPILHFETHGSVEGIQISNGERVSWESLIPLFREINIALKNYLLICFGSCFGGSIISLINPRLRSPFRSVVASVSEVGVEDVLAGFEAFYDCFFFSLDIQKSLDAMNQSTGGEKIKFHHLISEHCFDAICNADRDPDSFKSLVNNYAVIQKEINPKYKETSFESVFNEIEQEMRSLLDFTKENRNYFFMKDLRNK